MQLEGTMEYLAAMLGLGALCGCALGAYVLFEGIERDQEEDRARVAERALRPAGATLWPPVQLVYPPLDGRGWRQRESLVTTLESGQGYRWGGVAAHADRLDKRVRGLEVRLDRLVRMRAAVVSTSSGIAAQAE